MVCAMPKTLGC